MRRSTIAVAAAAAIALIGGSAGAAPTTTITSPADGATVSRAETPTLSIQGTAAFDDPVPTNRQIYLRYSGNASTCGSRYVSDVNGADGGNGCTVVASPPIVPQQVEGTFAAPYPDSQGEVAYPLTLDATRNITGTIAVASVTPNALVFDVRVTLGSQTLVQTITAPPYVGSWLIGNPVSYPVSIDIPDSMDKADVSSMSVTIVWRQWVNVGASTWIEHDAPASFLSVPAYTASFNRKVETRIGTSGSWTAATLDAGLTSWSASLPTPAAGSYFLQARPVQGGKAGTVAQNVLHVTA